MFFDEAVATVALQGFVHEGGCSFAIPVFRHRRRNPLKQAGSFVATQSLIRGARHTEGKGGVRLALQGKIGQDRCHHGLVNQRALKCAAVSRVVECLDERMSHQSSGADREIESGQMRHLDGSADAAAFLA
jgi:hypothetical protein